MFRFSIRDVLWLTVVVGLGLGWLLDHKAAADRFTRMQRVLILSGGQGGVDSTGTRYEVEVREVHRQ